MAPAYPRSSTRNGKPKRKFSNNVPPGLHLLPPLDPKSAEFTEVFGSLLSSKDERTNILALPEQDARIFIEIIDRAVRAVRLDARSRQLSFNVLRKLCGRTGHLPDSYLLSDKFNLSGMPRASGGFADVRMGVFEGKEVAVKTLRVSEADDKVKIRKHFCKEVALWKNLCHPNILNLIGVPDTLEDGRFSMVSEWMVNGNIIEYVRNKAGNHLKLLADAVEGLKYLHNSGIAHGGLKGADILITNTNPVSACLADFGFMTIVCDPSLEMEPPESIEGRATTPFMAPELLLPSRFGLDEYTPTKEADIYAMGMVTYQVLTGKSPFCDLPGSEVFFKVLGGERPSKPANALELGLSGEVWKLLEDCWQPNRISRPSVRDVSDRVKGAASVCGILSPVGGIPQRYGDLDLDFPQFDSLFLGMPSYDEELGFTPMERPPSLGSILTDTSLPDSLFSELSDAPEAKVYITKPPRTRPDALPDISFSPALDHTPHFRFTPDPISQSSAFGLETGARLRPFRNNSSPYRNKIFAESSGSSSGLTLFPQLYPTTRRHTLRSCRQ